MEKLRQLVAPPDLNIGEGYAKVIHTAGLALVFAPAWPPAYLLTTVSLIMIYFTHRVAITKHFRNGSPLGGKTAFAAIQVLYVYVLAHIIMCFFYLSRAVNSIQAGNEVDNQYARTNHRPYRNGQGNYFSDEQREEVHECFF